MSRILDNAGVSCSACHTVWPAPFHLTIVMPLATIFQESWLSTCASLDVCAYMGGMKGFNPDIEVSRSSLLFLPFHSDNTVSLVSMHAMASLCCFCICVCVWCPWASLHEVICGFFWVVLTAYWPCTCPYAQFTLVTCLWLPILGLTGCLSWLLRHHTRMSHE